MGACLFVLDVFSCPWLLLLAIFFFFYYYYFYAKAGYPLYWIRIIGITMAMKT